MKNIIPRKGIILSSEDACMEEQSWWAAPVIFLIRMLPQDITSPQQDAVN